MNPKLITLFALAASISAANASILIQELFDTSPGGGSLLDGVGDNSSTVGLADVWTTYGSPGIFTSPDFDVDGGTLPGLPSNGGTPGSLFWSSTSNWSTDIYATRPLATPIDFGVDRVIYFSVRLDNLGDTSVGIGLASGADATSNFVGAGFSWNNAQPLSAPSSNIAGNSSYISHGVLDGAVDRGVYGIRAYDGQNTINGIGLLVGRITIKSTGDDVIEIKRYLENDTIDNNLEAISWSTTSMVNSSMVASHLLLWMNGADLAELDAIRFGDTWTDVTGVALVGEGQPSLSGSSVGSFVDGKPTVSVNLFNSDANVTLFWDEVDQGTGTWANSSFLGNRLIGSVSGEIAGIAPDMTYFYRFQAVNPNVPDFIAWSEAARSFTSSLAGKAVDGVQAFPESPYEVTVLWWDDFLTESGFMIQRSPAGAGTWTTVGTTGADLTSYTDAFSGLAAETSYDYRVIATSASGNSDPSNISNATTPATSALETKLFINFDGTLDGGFYTLGSGEIDLSGTFKANGAPAISGGFATLNPGNEYGPDGFDIDPIAFGNLATQNWVAEMVVTYQSTGADGTSPVLIDVQGDCNLRLRDDSDNEVLQMFYWNGSSVQQRFTAMPPTGVKVHLAYAWDAGSATLTGYVNGVAFGSIGGQGAFTTPDAGNLSFGYFGRNGFEGRGIDGVLDAVAFQAGTADFDPATGFLILPESESFATWIGGFPTNGVNGFEDDADGDGLKNGIEGFLGTNPSLANGNVITQMSTTGAITTFSHPQKDPALSDVNASYEWSLDLENWYVGDGVDGPAGGPTVAIPAVSPVGGNASVIATSSAPLTRIFFRISVSN